MNEKELKELALINFVGNIIPHAWFKTLTKDGTPYLDAIVILSEIVYWYRPTIEKKDDGTIFYRKKFTGDILQLSYKQIEQRLGINKKKAQRALKFLEEKNIISREFRTVKTEIATLPNIMFIRLNIEQLKNITALQSETEIVEDTLLINEDFSISSELMDKSVQTYGHNCPDIWTNLSTYSTKSVHTITENNTENTKERNNNLNNIFCINSLTRIYAANQKFAAWGVEFSDKTKEKINLLLKSKSVALTREDIAAAKNSKVNNQQEQKTTTEKKSTKRKKSTEEALGDKAQKEAKSQNKGVIPDKQKQIENFLFKLFLFLYQEEFGAKYTEYAKLRKLVKKAAEWLFEQDWSDEERVRVAFELIEFAFRRGKASPIYIFGAMPSLYAEYKKAKESSFSYWRNIILGIEQDKIERQAEVQELTKETLGIEVQLAEQEEEWDLEKLTEWNPDEDDEDIPY